MVNITDLVVIIYVIPEATKECRRESVFVIGDFRYFAPQFWNDEEFWIHNLVVNIGELLGIVYVIPDSDEGA